MKRKILFLFFSFLAFFPLPATSFAWTTPTYTDTWSQPTYTDTWSSPTYTDIWSQPTYTDIWSDPVYTDIWSEVEYTDNWSGENIVYEELEEGSVKLTVTPTRRDSYYVLLRSTDFNDPEIYKILTEPEYVDLAAYAGHTYIYLFVTFDKNHEIIGYSNIVVVKVLPKKNGTPVTPVTPVKPTPAYESTIVLQINNPIATVDGTQKTLNVAPIVQNGRTLVPLRFIGESMGAKVDWNGDEQKVTVLLDGNTIILWINKRETLVNGKTVLLDVPANTINGSTFVPIRFISENFGRKVNYDSTTQKITIKAGATSSNQSFLFGTWDLWVPGSFNFNGDYVFGAGGDVLQIKSDGTYIWNAVDGSTLKGTWKQNGSNIIISKGRYNSDWTVAETKFSDGTKGIKVYSLGMYYEGRKR